MVADTDSFRVLVVGASDRMWKIIEPLESEGVQTDSFSFRGKESIRPFINQARNTDPDIVLTESIGWIGAIVLLVSILTRTPYAVRLRGDAVTEHGIWIRSHFNNRAPFSLAKECVKTACTVVTLLGTQLQIHVSEYLRDSSRSRYLASDSATVIPTPVKELPEADESGSKSNSTILMVSNFTFPTKTRGVIDGIEKVSGILEKYPEWRLRIAGGGPYLDQVRSKSETVSSGSIEVLGFVEDIESEYENADIFIHFSHLDAYPSTVLEAKSYGLPVVANKKVGMVDQVEDGKTGYLVDLSDDDGIKTKLSALIENEEKRRKFGINGKEEIMQNNSVEAVGAELARYLQNHTDDDR